MDSAVSAQCLASFSAIVHIGSRVEWDRDSDIGKAKEIRAI